jgi:hypothetical protein
VVALVSIVLSASPVAGCGGGGPQQSRRQEPTRTDARGKVPQVDQDAYLAIARASGALRASAAAAAVNKAPSLTDRHSLRYAASLVRGLHPRDHDLAALQVAIGAALKAALAAPGDARAQRRAAVAAIAATDTINRGLRRYANRHPYVLGLIPD